MSTDVGLWRIKTVPALKELNADVSWFIVMKGGGSRVVVSTAAFHARVWGSFTGLGDLKKNKNVSSPSTHKTVVSPRDRDVACSVSDLQGLNFETCVWRAVSSHSSHHPQEVLLIQFSLYVHKSGLSSFHIFIVMNIVWIQLKFGNTWNLQCTACAFILFWSDRRYQFHSNTSAKFRILVQVTIYRRLQIGPRIPDSPASVDLITGLLTTHSRTWSHGQDLITSLLKHLHHGHNMLTDNSQSLLHGGSHISPDTTQPNVRLTLVLPDQRWSS